MVPFEKLFSGPNPGSFFYFGGRFGGPGPSAQKYVATPLRVGTNQTGAKTQIILVAIS